MTIPQQNQSEISDALSGADEDQRRIAEQGLAVVALLLRKNSDYGSSAWQPPSLKPTLNAGDAILVRMSDKVARIGSLASKSAMVDESLEDTIQDLCGYCMLWLARPGQPERREVG